MTAHTLTAAVKAGKLEITDRMKEKLRAALKQFRDGDVRVRIEKVRAKHSDAQRAYYHAVVVEAAMTYTHYTHDEQHELLKALHLDKGDAREGRNGRLLKAEGGEYYVIGGSTSGLDRVKYGEYVDRCRDWILRQFGEIVDDPDPSWRTKAAETAA